MARMSFWRTTTYSTSSNVTFVPAYWLVITFVAHLHSHHNVLLSTFPPGPTEMTSATEGFSWRCQ